MKNKKITMLLEGMVRISQIISKDHQKDIKGNDNTTISFESGENIATITTLHYKQLHNLFPQIRLSQVINDFNEYLTLPSQILGKRSSKIILSKSSKYCLKIVEQPDIDQIENNFQGLSLRFSNPLKNCLAPLYFIFLIDYAISGVKLTDRYILMPNIRAHFDLEVRTFDIKGHLDTRVIDHEDFEDFKFGKDENFVHSQELRMIKKMLDNEKLAIIIEHISETVTYLAEQNIIDYSLLFSIEKLPLKKVSSNKNQFQWCQHEFLGDQMILKWMIIDYFQLFTEKKKLQGKFKSLFRKTVSSVEPKVYSQRLIKFLKKYLLG